MLTLYHYSRKCFSIKVKGPAHYERKDSRDKPGGLWLSADGSGSHDGWFRKILDSTGGTNLQWCRHDIKYETELKFTNDIPTGIALITCQKELDSFKDTYREPDLERCKLHTPSTSRCLSNFHGRCSYCFGVHIQWRLVRKDFKGIAILPFEKNFSHVGGDPNYHWNSFDCSSWCLWDIEYLTDSGFYVGIEDSKQMFRDEDLGDKCSECVAYFQRTQTT